MPIMHLKINNGIEVGDVEIATASFKELALKENDVEEFLRKNIRVIFGEEETLLIVGVEFLINYPKKYMFLIKW